MSTAKVSLSGRPGIMLVMTAPAKAPVRVGNASFLRSAGLSEFFGNARGLKRWKSG